MFQLIKNIPAATFDLLKLCLLFVAEFAIGEDDFDIEENDREASDPVPIIDSALLKIWSWQHTRQKYP
jgi:hypothetical protein